MTATDRALELVRAAAQAASDKLAENIIAFDVSEQLVITDAFLLCSAPNDRQVKAIVDEVEDRLREIGAKPVRREGERDGRWVLIDYADIVVHVQHEEERAFYALERLWRDCPLIALPESVTSAPARRQLTRGPSMTQQPSAARPAPARTHRLEPHRPGPGPRRRAARRGRSRPGAGRGRRAWRRSAPARLWSSDLARAAQTADHVAAATGLEVEEDARLREFDVGERQGLTWDEAVARFPGSPTASGWGAAAQGVPGAETDADVGRRIVPAVEDCFAALGAGGDRRRGDPRRRAQARARGSAGLGRARVQLPRRAGQLPLGDRRRARRGPRRGGCSPTGWAISHPPPPLAKIPGLPRPGGATGASGGAVAQLVAHLHGMEGVRGSSPLSSTEHSEGRSSRVALRRFRAPPGPLAGPGAGRPSSAGRGRRLVTEHGLWAPSG